MVLGRIRISFLGLLLIYPVPLGQLEKGVSSSWKMTLVASVHSLADQAWPGARLLLPPQSGPPGQGPTCTTHGGPESRVSSLYPNPSSNDPITSQDIGLASEVLVLTLELILQQLRSHAPWTPLVHVGNGGLMEKDGFAWPQMEDEVSPRFLLLLSQIAIHVVAENNINILPYSSGHEKSSTQGVSRVPFPLEAAGGSPFPCLFQHLEAICIPCFVALPSVFRGRSIASSNFSLFLSPLTSTSIVTSLPLTLTLLPPSLKDTCEDTGFVRIIQDKLPISRS